MGPAPDLTAGFEVTLRADLTRYDAALRAGSVGRTELPAGRTALYPAKLLRCSFPGVARAVDVLRRDLEVTDARYLAWQRQEAADREDALANHVSRARLITGIRGGFRELVVEYGNGRPTDRWKRHSEARPIIERLRAAGRLK